MIKEQNLKPFSEPDVIIKTLREKDKYIDEKENIEYNFFGNKELLEEKKDEQKDSKNYLVGKYKDIYIGLLSLDKPEIRENFGLNKYFNDIFYIGQWKDNKKQGIGFLKLKDNILYLGEFSNNQINGFGILYYKEKKHIFFGDFIDGKMDNGLYYNIEDSIFYHGKFKNGKKNDEFCLYIDFKNKHIFAGKVVDDVFVKGYFSICDIQEKEEDNEFLTSFTCEKIIYFDKEEGKKIKFEHFTFFEDNLADSIYKVFSYIFEFSLDIKDLHENYTAFFDNLENIVYNDSYTEYLERYNPEEKMNIKNMFLKNYNIYYKRYIQSQEKFSIEIFESIIKNEPKLKMELKNEIEKAE
jgi:hypothetical protein